MIHQQTSTRNQLSIAVNEKKRVEQSKVRLLLVIRSLDYGGAQRQLITLAKGMDKNRFAVVIVTFYDGGGLRPEIEGIEGVQLLSLHKRGRWDWARCLRRFDCVVREFEPQIVHGYMDSANELCLFARRRTNARVVWGLRQSLDSGESKPESFRDAWVPYCSYRVGAWLSRYADLIIVNSHAGKAAYIKAGYAEERMLVIHNGIDTQRFRPDLAARCELRREWGVGETEILIGLVARLDLVKDHPNFLRAAALVSKQRDNVRFVCVGTGPAAYQHELQSLADELGLCNRLHWIQAHRDMPAVYNALDLASCTSTSEGFSNVIGEAMACGTPCVVTDVGDLAVIVDNREQVVSAGNPQALAAAWQRVMDLNPAARAAVSQRSRERINQEFSLRHLIDKTEAALLASMR
jgi:glycosyltransferase involved in cell wall biosynthesis